MKRPLCIISLCLIIFNIQSQEIFTKYYSSAFKEKYNIEISVFNDSTYLIFIDVQSMDILCNRTGFNLTHLDHSDFINELRKAKKKYIEWKNVAIKNNVKEFTKTIETDFKFISVYFYQNGELNLQVFVEPKFLFSVNNINGKQNYHLIIYSGEIQSSTNQYIEMEGFSLVFSSEIEIQNFINLISTKNINTYIKKPKTDDLFK